MATALQRHAVDAAPSSAWPIERAGVDAEGKIGLCVMRHRGGAAGAPRVVTIRDGRVVAG